MAHTDKFGKRAVSCKPRYSRGGHGGSNLLLGLNYSSKMFMAGCPLSTGHLSTKIS